MNFAQLTKINTDTSEREGNSFSTVTQGWKPRHLFWYADDFEGLTPLCIIVAGFNKGMHVETKLEEGFDHVRNSGITLSPV